MSVRTGLRPLAWHTLANWAIRGLAPDVYLGTAELVEQSDVVT